jgi:hypothetical protein
MAYREFDANETLLRAYRSRDSRSVDVCATRHQQSLDLARISGWQVPKKAHAPQRLRRSLPRVRKLPAGQQPCR